MYVRRRRRRKQRAGGRRGRSESRSDFKSGKSVKVLFRAFIAPAAARCVPVVVKGVGSVSAVVTLTGKIFSLDIPS